MSWMSPSTILLDGLTTKESRLAAKYSLHLYREREWDRGIEDGVRSLVAADAASLLVLPFRS